MYVHPFSRSQGGFFLTLQQINEVHIILTIFRGGRRRTDKFSNLCQITELVRTEPRLSPEPAASWLSLSLQGLRDLGPPLYLLILTALFSLPSKPKPHSAIQLQGHHFGIQDSVENWQWQSTHQDGFNKQPTRPCVNTTLLEKEPPRARVHQKQFLG